MQMVEPPAPQICGGPLPAPRDDPLGVKNSRGEDTGVRTKMSDVHAERAPEALMDPADQWGTLGASSKQRARAARASEGV